MFTEPPKSAWTEQVILEIHKWEMTSKMKKSLVRVSGFTYGWAVPQLQRLAMLLSFKDDLWSFLSNVGHELNVLFLFPLPS